MEAPISPSPERNNENTPRDTPRLAVIGFRKIARVLARAKDEVTLATKPTATIYQP